MEAAAGKMTSQEPQPTLQLKRPLLPIDEYAAREGISTEVVEEYARQGIVQLRKYKGKTFVVDVPSNPYLCESETAVEPPQPLDETNHTADAPDTIQTPDLQAPEITNGTSEFDDEPMRIEKRTKAIKHTRDDKAHLALLTAQAKSKRTWQIATVFSLGCLCVALAANLWFYMNHKAQLEKLNGAYASIQQLASDSAQTNQQLKAVQSGLDGSRAQLKRLQNELNNSRAQVKLIQSELDDSRAELKTVQDEFAQAEQRFKLIQQRNAEAAKQLKEQIQRFSEQLAELSRNRQRPPALPGL